MNRTVSIALGLLAGFALLLAVYGVPLMFLAPFVLAIFVPQLLTSTRALEIYIAVTFVLMLSLGILLKGYSGNRGSSIFSSVVLVAFDVLSFLVLLGSAIRLAHLGQKLLSLVPVILWVLMLLVAS
jgi:hypothetical protein